MKKTSYVNFNTNEGLESYREKASRNLSVFAAIFGFKPASAAKLAFQNVDEENQRLIAEIAKRTQLPTADVQGMNYSDELLSSSPNNPLFGCTAVGKNGIIGQNLDLFTLDLTVVREDDVLYLTMPPYLTLFGMNREIAFCTNYLPYSVTSGVPLSYIRRNILRQHSLPEAVKYLSQVHSATAANFFLSDGSQMCNIEVLPSGARVQNAIPSANSTYFAHTNHTLQRDIRQDQSCPRLSQAVKRLETDRDIESILLERGVYVPIEKIEQKSALGFGSIITVILDPLRGTFSYNDCFMDDFNQISL